MDGFSIILPAHNEGAVIERTLRSIMASRVDRPMQIIVVANGCSDDTAARARAVGGAVEVIELAEGSKVKALNAGDAAAKYFPRAFMDADVELSPGLLQSVVDAFKESAVHLVAPECRHLYTGWNPFLAGYYKLWKSLPYVKNDSVARGFYAIDADLRSRFETFPTLTADDRFIRNLARPEERRIVSGGYTTVYMPATFRDLLAVKTRWTYGNLQLAASRPDLNVNDQEKHEGGMGFVLKRPWLWPHLPAFVFVYWYSHRQARKRLAAKQGGWERANSSRETAKRV